MFAQIIIHNAKISTNTVPWLVEALAIVDGHIQATGTNDDILALRGPLTEMIDAAARSSLASEILHRSAGPRAYAKLMEPIEQNWAANIAVAQPIRAKAAAQPIRLPILRSKMNSLKSPFSG